MNKNVKTRLIPLTALVLVVSPIVLALASIPSKPVAVASERSKIASSSPSPEQQDQAHQALSLEGRVVPAVYATLSMPTAGIVAESQAEEGDALQAGQAILRLRDEQQRAAVARSKAALASAQANLDAVKAGPRVQQIDTAQAALDGAMARLRRLNEAGRPKDIVAAQAVVDAARMAMLRQFEGKTSKKRVSAEALLSDAEVARQAAQTAYDKVADQPNAEQSPEHEALQKANKQYETAKARFYDLFTTSAAQQVAQLRAQVKQAQANLDRLLEPATASELAEAEAGAREALAQLDLLTSGATDAELAAAQAAVAEAQAALEQAQAAMDETVLRAPFAATLSALYVREGEAVFPSVAVAEVGDLSQWHVETTDVTEMDITAIGVGQQVSLTFDALPGLTLPGTVLFIRPLGVVLRSSVAWKIIVQPDQTDVRLRWGMTAWVTIP